MALVDFAINLACSPLSWSGTVCAELEACLFAVLVGLGVLASLGPAASITALNVKYRDFRYVIPFIVQFGLYVVAGGLLDSSCHSGEWRFGTSLNPVVGVIDGFRWCILGGESTL